MLLLGNLGKAFATAYRASGLVPWHKADHLGRILAACLNYSENMRFLVSQPSIHAGFRGGAATER